MVLTTLEKVLYLKSVPLFSDVGVGTLAPVAETAEVRQVAAGTLLIRQGDAGDCLYLVIEGEVSVRLAGGAEIARRGPGTVLGEMAVISSRPRSADCVAESNVTVLRIDRDDFWDLMALHPDLAQSVIEVLAERLDEAVANLRSMPGPPREAASSA